MIQALKGCCAALVSPFRSRGRFDVSLILVFSAIQGLVLLNACLHDPGIVYDADGHLAYIETLSKMRLVTPEDSHEFFNPPLSYFLPALLLSSAGVPLFWVAKIAQVDPLYVVRRSRDLLAQDL